MAKIMKITDANNISTKLYKKIFLPKLKQVKMEIQSDEFISEAEKFKYDPEVLAYKNLHSEDSVVLSEKMKEVRKNRKQKKD